MATRKPFPISAGRAFRLRHGVGIDAKTGEEAREIYAELKRGWEEFLSKQDSGGFRPHYSVQKKVEDEEVVERTLEKVRGEFGGSKGMVLGLTLYRYDRGYWRKERDFMFP